MARSLGSLGTSALVRRDFTAARALYEEAVAIMREVGDRRGTAVGLHCLGNVAYDTGDLQSARVLLEESLSINREIGARSAAEDLQVLARVWYVQGDYETARRLLMESLHAQQESGDRRMMGATLALLGIISHDEGDISTAKADFKAAFSMEQAVGSADNLAAILEAMAALCLEFAPVTYAARIWGSAEQIRKQAANPAVGPDRERCLRYIARARRELHDDAAFDGAWNEGRSWTTDEAVKYAMNLLTES